MLNKELNLQRKFLIKMTKAILFDASTLISFSMNGILYILEELKKNFNGKFIITKEVKYEIIDRPLKIKRFKLEALKLNELLKKGVLEMPSVFGINEEEISKRTQKILDIANSMYQGGKGDIHILDLGEASCLELSKMLNDKKIPNVIATDERTTRMLAEKPENLKKLLQKKLHSKVSYNKEKAKHFRPIKIIRSTEIAYVAYKKGLTKLKGKQALDALLFALKFKGCSISYDEIEEIERLG